MKPQNLHGKNQRHTTFGTFTSIRFELHGKTVHVHAYHHHRTNASHCFRNEKKCHNIHTIGSDRINGVNYTNITCTDLILKWCCMCVPAYVCLWFLQSIQFVRKNKPANIFKTAIMLIWQTEKERERARESTKSRRSKHILFCLRSHCTAGHVVQYVYSTANVISTFPGFQFHHNFSLPLFLHSVYIRMWMKCF